MEEKKREGAVGEKTVIGLREEEKRENQEEAT